MSVVSNHPSATSKPRKQRFFEIVFQIEGDSYKISLLPCDPSIAVKAFRLRKLTAEEPTTYDVRFTEHGPECECLGFLRHGHCKHIQVLIAASNLFSLA